MYRNLQNNQLFTKEVDVIFADKAMFKTITDKNNTLFKNTNTVSLLVFNV